MVWFPATAFVIFMIGLGVITDQIIKSDNRRKSVKSGVKRMKYEIILEKEDDGRISAHVPALPGCHSWGNNKQEAINNAKEAIEGYLEVLNLRINDYRRVGESVEIEI